MDRYYRVRIDDSSRLLELVRRALDHAGPLKAQQAVLEIGDTDLLREVARLMRGSIVPVTLMTASPAALLACLPDPLDLHLRQVDAEDAPETWVIPAPSNGSVRWSWNRLTEGLRGGGVDRAAARELVTGYLIDRFTRCVDAGIVDLGRSPEAWMRELLAVLDESGPNSVSRWFHGQFVHFDRGPPAVPRVVQLSILADVVRAAACAPIWHDREPVRIEARLTDEVAGSVELPAGSLEAIGVNEDPGPALDLLFAARERLGAHFWLFWECDHWKGQEEYFTAGSGTAIRRDDDGVVVLDLWTSLRYPAATTVTGDIEESWCSEADAFAAKIAAALGVEIEPPRIL